MPLLNPGAPANASYITQVAEAGLTAEQNLAALTTGLAKVTTATGVLSTAVAADLPSHNASQHDDITRTFFVPAYLGTVDSGTLGTAGTLPNAVRCVACADAATQGFYFTIQTPADMVTGNLSITLYWLPGSTDASSHSVQWSINALALTAGIDGTSAGTTTAFTGTAAARTANQLAIDATTVILASIAANTVIRMDVRRLGADAADTYVGTVNIVGSRFDYTANQ